MTIIGFPQDLPSHQLSGAVMLLLEATRQAEHRMRKAAP
jgi:hypothetical protein